MASTIFSQTSLWSTGDAADMIKSTGFDRSQRNFWLHDTLWWYRPTSQSVKMLIFPPKRITASETHNHVVSRRQTRTFACESGSTRQPHTVTHRFPNDSCDDCKSSMSVGSKQRSPWAKVYRLSIWINRSGNIPLLGHYPLKISFSSGAFPKQNVLLYYLCHYYGIIIRLVFHRQTLLDERWDM